MQVSTQVRFDDAIKDNIDLIMLAEKFGDPLFEKVTKLTSYGRMLWLAYFKQVGEKHDAESMKHQIAEIPMHPSGGFHNGFRL